MTISRASGATSDSMLKIAAGTVTLQNIALDGGAVWNSDMSSRAAQVLGHGKINNGLTAGAPAIFLCPAAYIGNYTTDTTWNSANAPTLTLADVAVIQNNVSTSNAGGIHAFCSTLYIAGGSILNCGAGAPNTAYSLSGTSSGTAMNIQGSHFFFSSGTVSGNYGGSDSFTAIALGSTSYAFCIMSGGTVQNNVSTRSSACGAIMLDDGNSRYSNLWLTGGTIRNNVGNVTGGIGVWSDKDLRNVSLSNTAAANNRDYSTVITPLSGYQMPDSFTVTVNSTVYTVNTATGAVTVNGSAASGISYAVGTKQLSIAASMIKSGTTINISGEAPLIPTLTATALSGSSSEYGTAAPKSFSIADHDFSTAPTSYTAQWCDASGNTSGASSAGAFSVGAVTNGDAVLTLTPSAAADAIISRSPAAASRSRKILPLPKPPPRLI